jgi:hypothetical protein
MAAALVGKPKTSDNSKENEYQRNKMAYKPPTQEQIVLKELHLQYIRDNYDPKTGKPKEGWMSEDEWQRLST